MNLSEKLAERKALREAGAVSVQAGSVSEKLAQRKAERETQEAAPAGREQGYFENITNSAANGVTFGVVDEVGAAGGAVGRSLKQMVSGEPVTLGQNYDDVLSEKRGQAQKFGEEYPVSDVTANVVGSFANPLAKLLPGGGKGRAGKAVQGAVVGGGMGGLYGAGNSEGDLAGRAVDGAIGAGLGGALGAAAPSLVEALGYGVNKAVSALTKAIGSKAGGVTSAQAKVAQQLRIMGNGNMKKGIEIVREKIREGGEGTVLADVLDIGGQKLTRGAANVPGPAGKQVDEFVLKRMSGRGKRLQKAADVLSPKSFHDEIAKITTKRSAEAAPLYKKAFEPVSDKAGKVFAQWDERLQEFLDSDDVRKGMALGIKNIRREALADGKPFNFKEFAVKGFDKEGQLIIEGTPNLRAMDAGKRGLDSMIAERTDPLTGKMTESGRALEKVRKALVAKLDDITTDENGYSAYKAARKAWSGPSKIIDAADRGRKFMKGDYEVTKKLLSKMPDAEKEAFRLGVRREISKMIDTDTQSAINKFADKKVDFWNKLKAVFPDEKTLFEFRRQITNEAKKARMEQFVSPKSGSQTAGLTQDIDDLSRVPSGALNNLEAIAQLLSGRPVTAAATAGRPALNKLTAPNQRTAAELMDYLLANGKKADEILPLLSKAVGRNALSAPVIDAGGRGVSSGRSSRN